MRKAKKRDDEKFPVVCPLCGSATEIGTPRIAPDLSSNAFTITTLPKGGELTGTPCCESLRHCWCMRCGWRKARGWKKWA